MVGILTGDDDMYYGEDIINEVRDRSDIVDVIGTYVSLKRAGRSYKGLCPFHNEKTPSFHVTPDRRMFYCFGCHMGGDVFTFLQEYENMTFSEAVQFLADRAGMTLPEKSDFTPADRKRDELKEQIIKANSLAGQFYYSYLRDKKGAEGMAYLRDRGVSDEMLHKFALGFAPMHGGLYRFLKSKGFTDDVLKATGLFVYDEKKGPYDKFWNRVMFPIVDRRNHVVGFGGRVMGDGKPKYLNSPETIVFDKSRNLFGINYLHGKLKDGVILCEGYMDVIALHQAGFTNAVAALGTAFTISHVTMLKRMTDEAYLCFDSDGAGTDAAIRAIPMLKEVGIRTKVIRMEPHKDPDEFIKALGRDAFEERIKSARSSFFFESDVIARNYNMDDPESKTGFLREIAGKVTEFEDEIERSNYIEAIAREYGVRTEDFRALVVKIAAKRGGVGTRTPETGTRQVRSTFAEDSLYMSYGMLFTWLCEHPESFEKIRGYVSCDDIYDEPYHSVAVKLYDQLAATGRVDAAAILNDFSDNEKSVVAGIFHKDDELDGGDGNKTINEVVRGILNASVSKRSASATSVEDVNRMLVEKQKLQKMIIEI